MAIWIFLSVASIDRDYYALCFFGRVASRRSVYNALSVNCSVHIFRIFLSESSFLGRTFFWWLSGLRLAFGPSSGAPVWFRQSLPFLGRQIFFSLGLWLWTVSCSHNCLMASASRFYWFIVRVFCCCTLESDCLVCLESRGVYFGAHLANDTATRKLTRAKDNLP